MGNYLNVGNDGFAAAVKGIYVDKTDMISFINSTLETKDKLTCVSRPRRFGKSFAAQMLCAYYDKSCDSHELFENLVISKDPSYEKYLNKFNVIYLDITLFSKGADLAESLARIADETGEKFIMIIDEWDALFREAKDDAGLQKEYIDLLRSLFKSSWTDKIFAAQIGL